MLLAQAMIELLHKHIQEGGSIKTFLAKYKIKAEDANMPQIKKQLADYMAKLKAEGKTIPKPAEKPMPSMVQQMKNLGTFAKNQVKDVVTKGRVKVPLTQGEKRFAICQKCPHFKPETSRCSLCGCFMKTKTKFTAAKCPDNPPRWK
jgi:hypothetical protein